MTTESQRRRGLGRALGTAVMMVLVAGTASLQAQSTALGTFIGRVIDDTGASLPGVAVSATGPALLVPEVVAVTDASGDYRIGDLPPGVYRLQFEPATAAARRSSSTSSRSRR